MIGETLSLPSEAISIPSSQCCHKRLRMTKGFAMRSRAELKLIVIPETKEAKLDQNQNNNDNGKRTWTIYAVCGVSARTSEIVSVVVVVVATLRATLRASACLRVLECVFLTVRTGRS